MLPCQMSFEGHCGIGFGPITLDSGGIVPERGTCQWRTRAPSARLPGDNESLDERLPALLRSAKSGRVE